MSKEQFLESIFKQIRDQYPEAKNQKAFVEALAGRIEQNRSDHIKRLHGELTSLLNEGETVRIVLESQRREEA